MAMHTKTARVRLLHLPIGLLTFAFTLALAPASAGASVDDEHWHHANAALDRGIDYLREQQNDDGSWSPDPGPAVTALVVTVMLDRPHIGPDDPAVQKGIDFILTHVQDDGGIYDQILANYNTSLCLSALSRVHGRADVAQAVNNAETFLRELQWQPGMEGPDGEPITEDHPYYGGAGYGKHGRPDLSNTHLMLQALHDAGVSCEDPAFERAVTFVSRLQGGEHNDMFDEQTVEGDGGFIYATSVNSDNVGVPQSMANPEQIDEARAGRAVSGLRTYGSMTYAGFKSYIYAMPAQLDRDDPRITLARQWIAENYTLEQNPGMPEPIQHHGQYYYYMTFARALDAWGASTVETAAGEQRYWANDLVAKLVELQRPDGSWTNEADRWMESDPNLVTAYALMALNHAIR